MFILKSGSSGYTAEVDDQNRIKAFSTSQTDATARALAGDSFNINTQTINLSTDSASGVLYVVNEDTVSWVINRVFYNVGASTNGASEWLAEVISDPSGGTLLTAGTDTQPHNFNLGSPKLLPATSLKGAEGLTVIGGEARISTLVPTPSVRILIQFDSVIVEPGTALAVVITPPVGNTSFNVQAGCNIFRRV